MVNLFILAIEWNRTLKALLLYVVAFVLLIAIIVLIFELISKKEDYIQVKEKTKRVVVSKKDESNITFTNVESNDEDLVDKQKTSDEPVISNEEDVIEEEILLSIPKKINEDKEEIIALSIPKKTSTIKEEVKEEDVLVFSLDKNKGFKKEDEVIKISIPKKVKKEIIKYSLHKKNNVLLKSIETDDKIVFTILKNKGVMTELENDNMVKLSLKKKNNNKKIITTLMLLLCVFLLSSLVPSIAKFITSQSSDQNAQLAEFIEINKDDVVSVIDLNDVIIDPTSDSVSRLINIHNNGETLVLCKFVLTTTGNLPLVFSWSTKSEDGITQALEYERILNVNEKETYVLSILWDESYKSFLYTYDIDYITLTLYCEQYTGGDSNE